MSPTLLTHPPAHAASSPRLVVLFVDDEPRLLEGIARMLRPLRNEWEVLTANGGDEALAILARQSVDVLISDMRMPGMSGNELLETVAKTHPDTIRMILSGQADRDAMLRSIGCTHRYLSKPCDASGIRHAIHQAQDLRRYLVSPALSPLVARLQDLPSLPETYISIQQELKREDPSLDRISIIASRDLGLVAKLLQVANSGRNFRQNPVVKAHEAIQVLGIETVKTLVLAQHLLDKTHALRLGDLWQRSLHCGEVARAIAEAEGADALQADCCFSAGVLHDCGILLKGILVPQDQHRIQVAIKDGASVLEAERSIMGTTHQELGAYLLGLWGLPDPLVEAVAYHHTPSRSGVLGFCPLVAVHVASSLVSQGCSDDITATTPIDQAWLERLGLLHHLPRWQALANEVTEPDERP